jgi:hypothetical protein
MALMTSTLAAALLAQGPHASHQSRKSASAATPVSGSSAKRNAAHHKAEEAEVASASGTSDDQGDSTKGDATKGAAAKSDTTKGAKTRTYTFGALDVEGKMKTPQLLYFLNRVKLELEMSAPDKKSFMKDLERSADDSSL